MNPLWQSDAATAPWAPATSFSIGYPQSGDEVTGTQPTVIGPDWFEGMALEIKAVIEGAGLVYDPTDNTQFLRAVRILVAPSVVVVPAFAATPTTGSTPLTVSFTDTSNGAITAWAWDFGDGGTSAVQEPTHTYATAGEFDVSLTVSAYGATYAVTQAAFISAFAPSTSSTLLLHFEGSTFIDSGHYGMTVNGGGGGGSALTSAKSKFGTQSCLVDTGFLTVSDPRLVIGTQDFTIDLWVYFNSVAGVGCILDSRADGSNSSGVQLYCLSGQLGFSNGATGILGSAATLTTGQWTHIEACRAGGDTFYLFQDGVLIASGAGFDMNFRAGGFLFGAANYSPPGAIPMHGYLDEVHMVIGSALHTTNFTPPTAPYS